MPNALAISLHAIGVETSTGVGESIDIGASRSALVMRADVLAVAGTNPTLALEVQTSSDESTWRFAYRLQPDFASTGPSDEFYASDLARYVRVAWTIGGSDSPSFTFSLSGHAHVLYAGRQDSRLSEAQLKEASPGKVAEKYVKACAMADSYLGNVFTLPLLAWEQDLRSAVAGIADYEIMRKRGFDPDGPDGTFLTDMKNSMGWLEKVSRGAIRPAGVVDSTPETVEAGAYTSSRPKRGWVR